MLLGASLDLHAAANPAKVQTLTAAVDRFMRSSSPRFDRYQALKAPFRELDLSDPAILRAIAPVVDDLRAAADQLLAAPAAGSRESNALDRDAWLELIGAPELRRLLRPDQQTAAAEAAWERRRTRADRLRSRLLRAPAAALFDWDNTLVDEQEIRDAAAAEMFRRLGLPAPPPDEENRVWVTDRGSYYERFFPGVPQDVVDEAYDRALADLHAGKTINGRRYDLPRLLPGAKDLLDELRSRGIRMAIISNKEEGRLREEVERHGLTAHFELIQGRKDGRERKPSPKPVQEAIESLKVSPDAAWFVGDELVDMQAANQQGIQRVLVGRRWRAFVKDLARADDPAGPILYVAGCLTLLAVIRRSAAR